MTRILALVFAAFIPLTAIAADDPDSAPEALIRPAGDSDLSEFLWTNRPVVVFSDSPSDPRYQEQIELLAERPDMLRERDVVVLTDTDPAAHSPVRRKLRPRGFQLVLLDKDGSIRLRKPSPWSIREITRSIDKSPDRQHEVEERRERRE